MRGSWRREGIRPFAAIATGIAVSLCFALLVVAPAACAGPVHYQIRELPQLPGGYWSNARGINNSTQVVGSSASYAFLWDEANGIRSLDVPPGKSKRSATDINNLSQVVGNSENVPEDSEAFIWDGQNGVSGLGVLPSYLTSYAWGINDQGQVVGDCRQADQWVRCAYIWDKQRGLRPIKPLAANPQGKSWSCAQAVNNSGQVVGFTSTSGSSHAFIWDEVNGMGDISPSADSPTSSARDVNDRGEVVGDIYVPGTGSGWQAFIWDSSNGMRTLGKLPGFEYSNAYGINNKGQVVGFAFNLNDEQRKHAFIWDSANGMQDLGTLGGSWSWAFDINGLGQIVGYSLKPNGSAPPVLWTPVPEPSGALLLLCGAGALAGLVRRTFL